MFPVHVVDRWNCNAYRDEIEQHFRLRHEIYVGERGWHDLARPDGREIDAFDTDDAVYLLGILPGRGVVAGSRLVPSLKSHLMSEVFPQLAPAGVPRAGDIFEWTRFFVVPELRQPGSPCLAAGFVYCGIIEFCLQRAISRLSIVCETYWNNRLASLGWNPQPLGPPIEHHGEAIVGLLVDITEGALEVTRRTYGIGCSVLWQERQDDVRYPCKSSGHTVAPLPAVRADIGPIADGYNGALTRQQQIPTMVSSKCVPPGPRHTNSKMTV